MATRLSESGSGLSITTSQVTGLGVAIAFFYAVGTAAGGITGPLVFAKLIADGQSQTAFAFVLGAVLMILGGLVAAFLAV